METRGIIWNCFNQTILFDPKVETTNLVDHTFTENQIMQAKIIAINPFKKNETQLSLVECRRIFKDRIYTDEEIIEMRDFLFSISRIFFDFYNRSVSEPAKLINFKKKVYEKKSNSLCKSEHRRAS